MEHAPVPVVHEKVLRPGHITGKLPVSMRWIGGAMLPMPVQGGNPIPIRAMDQVGEEMILHLTVRKPKEDGKKYYMKPEFMFKGWHALVDKYKLKEGEKVYFWMDRGYLKIKVRVQPRTLILFGARILV